MGTKFVFARFGKFGLLGAFESKLEGIKKGDRVIAKTSRGVEMCTVLTSPVEASYSTQFEGNVLRVATPEDHTKWKEIDEVIAPKDLEIFGNHAKELGLPMKPVVADRLFSNDREYFYYLAPERVDFRELLRILLNQLKIRIDFRQVQNREFTKLTGGCGTCGRSLCCNSFLCKPGGVGYDSVNAQYLNPETAKIVGACGKLKCCLKYEIEAYEQADKILPRIGIRVNTKKGEGTVVSRNLMMCFVTLQDSEGKRFTASPEEILSTN